MIHGVANNILLTNTYLYFDTINFERSSRLSENHEIVEIGMAGKVQFTITYY